MMAESDAGGRRDLAGEAVALLRRLDVERAENPNVRPARMERLLARFIDLVVHGVLLGALVLSYSVAFGPEEEEPSIAPSDVRPRGLSATPPGGVGRPIDYYQLPGWDRATIKWETAVLAAAVAIALALSEALQTRLLGATVGKRWNGMLVVRAGSAGKASWPRIAVRGLVVVAPVVAMLALWTTSLTYVAVAAGAIVMIAVWTAGDRRHRGAQDRLTGTEVLSRGEAAELWARG